MVGRPGAGLKMPGPDQAGSTSFPNVFLVGDTTSTAPGLEGVSKSALQLADRLTG
jgi:phytoene dehydrogenase-like protein